MTKEVDTLDEALQKIYFTLVKNLKIVRKRLVYY